MLCVRNLHLYIIIYETKKNPTVTVGEELMMLPFHGHHGVHLVVLLSGLQVPQDNLHMTRTHRQVKS